MLVSGEECLSRRAPVNAVGPQKGRRLPLTCKGFSQSAANYPVKLLVAPEPGGALKFQSGLS